MEPANDVVATGLHDVAAKMDQRLRQQQLDGDDDDVRLPGIIENLYRRFASNRYLADKDYPPRDPRTLCETEEEDTSASVKVADVLKFINGHEYEALIDLMRDSKVSDDCPSSLGLTTGLKPWQAVGQAKLVRLADGPFRGGFLADSMGLGKSLQAVVAALRVKRNKGLAGFILICCPKQSVHQWMEEVLTHFDPISHPIHKASSRLIRCFLNKTGQPLLYSTQLRSQPSCSSTTKLSFTAINFCEAGFSSSRRMIIIRSSQTRQLPTLPSAPLSNGVEGARGRSRG